MSSGVRSIRVAPPPPAPASERLVREGPAGIAGLIVVIAFALSLVAPGATFAAVRNWTLSRTPASVTGGGPASVQVTATNTGDDGGGEAIGCVTITIPNLAFTVTGVTIDAVSDGDAWSASYAVGPTDTTVSLYSDSGGGNRLHGVPSEWVSATVSFTDTGSDGTFAWVGNAFNKEDCTDDFLMPRTLLVAIDTPVVNSPPVAAADTFSIAEDTTLAEPAPGVLANDSDLDGDPLTATLVSGPSRATTFSLAADGSFTYLPEADWAGSDSFTYVASDGTASSLLPATVTIGVTAVNDPPVGNSDSYGAIEDQLLTVPAGSGVLANDTDADGDPLTASLVSSTGNGVLSLAADGSFTYLPAANFDGTDTFSYLASDGSESSAATVVTISLNAVVDPPAAVDDSYAVAEDASLSVAAAGVLANDTDADGDSLVAQLVAGPASAASFTLNPDGSFSYVPLSDFSGADGFVYQASDGALSSADATVSISVTAVNDPPVAKADAYPAAEDTALSVGAGAGVLANDSDPDGPAMSAVLVAAPAHGSLTLFPDGAFSYLPDADWSGTDTFRYRASDGLDSSAPVTVTLSVAAVNDPPVAVADAASTTSGASVLVDVLANDHDPEADPLVVASFTQPAHGVVTRAGSQLRYTADAGYAGADTFTYLLSDGTASDTGRVSLVVAAPTPTPTPTTTVRPTPTPTPTPEPRLRPTPTPTPTLRPTPTVDPTSPPLASPSPAPVVESPSATETPAPSPTPSATATSRPSTAPEPAIARPSQGPFRLAPLRTGATAGLGAASLGSLNAFGWTIPALAFSVPGLLIVLAVAVQVSGTLVWLPAVRRSLGTFGLVRRRRREPERPAAGA